MNVFCKSLIKTQKLVRKLKAYLNELNFVISDIIGHEYQRCKDDDFLAF